MRTREPNDQVTIVDHLCTNACCRFCSFLYSSMLHSDLLLLLTYSVLKGKPLTRHIHDKFKQNTPRLNYYYIKTKLYADK